VCCVLRLGLNSCKVLEYVTSDGRLFQVFAAATGKARLPVVESLSHVDGTASAEVEDERIDCPVISYIRRHTFSMVAVMP